MDTLRWILVTFAFIAGWLVAGRAVTFRLEGPETRHFRVPVDLSRAARVGSCGLSIDARDAGIDAVESDGQWRVQQLDSPDAAAISRHRLLLDGTPLDNPHSTLDWIRENRSGFLFTGTSPSRGKIYLSLPEVRSADSRVEAEWFATRRRTPSEVAIASAIGLAGVGLLLAGFLLAPRVAPAALAALLTMFVSGCAACVIPGAFGARSAAEAVGLADTARCAGMAAVSLAAVAALWATLVARSLAAPIYEGVWQRTARGWTGPWAVLAVTAAILVLSACCVRSEVMPVPFWRVGNIGSFEIAGRLHFTDAGGWFNEGHALALGEQVSWSGRRPLHALWRAGQLLLSGGSATSACGLQLLLLAIGTTSLVVTLARTISPAGAIVAWLLLVQAAAGTVPAFMSEAPGFSAACIAFALLVDGTSSGSLGRRLVGWSMMGLALAIRPGPQLIMAVAPLSELAGTGGSRPVRALAASVAVLASFVVASVAFPRISAPGAMMNANAAHTLFGLAHGTGWEEGQRIFLAGDPSRASLSEADASRLMTDLALQRVIERPWDAMRKLVRDTGNGMVALAKEIPSALTRPILEPITGKYGSRAAAFLLLGIACMGLAQQFLRRQPVAELTMWCVLATVASLPFIWGDGEWRSVTVAMPALAACLACASFAQLPVRRVTRTLALAPARVPGADLMLRAATVTCFALPCLGLLAYELNRGRSRNGLVVSLADSDSVLVVAEHRFIKPAGVPSVGHEDFCAALRRLHPSCRVPGPLAELEPPFLVTSHCPSRRSRWTVVPGVDPGRGSAIRILATRDTNSEMVVVATAWEYVE